jgi:MerR family copper efflux transcriptional regulator
VRIGKAARESGISAKMIRYYESIGLVPCAERLESGYREYGNDDIELLRLIRRARDAGLSPERAGELARLWREGGRPEDLDATNALIAELKARAAAAGELAKLMRARRSRFRSRSKR